MQPGFPAIEQQPISRQVNETRRALIVVDESPPEERLYGDLDEVATEHLPLIDDIERRDITVEVELLQIQVLDVVEPLQTRLLLQQETAS